MSRAITRRTLLQQSSPPPGQARPDWQLICQVAAHMGFGEHFAYQSSEEIFDEIRRFANPKTGYDLLTWNDEPTWTSIHAPLRTSRSR